MRALLYLFICYLAGLHGTTAGRRSRKVGGRIGNVSGRDSMSGMASEKEGRSQTKFLVPAKTKKEVDCELEKDFKVKVKLQK